MSNSTSLTEIIATLSHLDERVYGRYAIQHDLLYRKIKKEEYDELILNAIECGSVYALKIMKESKSENASEIANYLGIEVVEKEGKPGAKRLVFASFTTPNLITLMKDPIEKASSLIRKTNKEMAVKFGYDYLYHILMAHEIFHFVENKYQDEIYTQTRKILLWKRFGFENHSKLRVLSEMAAMSFAKTISGVDYAPFMLDVVLHYPYDKSGAMARYQQILEIADNFQKEIESEA